MSEDDVEVDYEFHNDGAFVQVELILEEKLKSNKAHSTSFEFTEHVDR
jgi:hypothetical protein